MSQDKPKAGEKALRADGKRFAVVAARFNAEIVDRLVEGALAVFARARVLPGAITVFRCPGALEIPGLVRRISDSARFDGIVCLGVVIRGDTIHFDLVSDNAVRGVAAIADQGRIAIGNCILACETARQARDRAGGRLGNRGADAALAVIEMANQYADIPIAAHRRKGLES